MGAGLFCPCGSSFADYPYFEDCRFHDSGESVRYFDHFGFDRVTCNAFEWNLLHRCPCQFRRGRGGKRVRIGLRDIDDVADIGHSLDRDRAERSGLVEVGKVDEHRDGAIVAIAQPTTRREKASMTTLRYKKPDQVGT